MLRNPETRPVHDDVVRSGSLLQLDQCHVLLLGNWFPEQLGHSMPLEDNEASNQVLQAFPSPEEIQRTTGFLLGQ